MEIGAKEKQTLLRIINVKSLDLKDKMAGSEHQSTIGNKVDACKGKG